MSLLNVVQLSSVIFPIPCGVVVLHAVAWWPIKSCMTTSGPVPSQVVGSNPVVRTRNTNRPVVRMKVIG